MIQFKGKNGFALNLVHYKYEKNGASKQLLFDKQVIIDAQ
jgi:hypothetical protein